MYNRYMGNTGRVERVDEGPGVGQSPPGPPPSEHNERQEHDESPLRDMPHGPRSQPPRHEPRPVPGPPPGSIRPGPPKGGIMGELSGLLGKLSPLGLETEDIILLMILYLLYKESGDKDFLIMMGAMLIL